MSYEFAGPMLLRAVLLPFSTHDQVWPDIDDTAACREWLRQTTALPWFGAVQEASPRLAAGVDRVLCSDAAPDRQVARVTAATARSLLRAAGRPTPFGLFAGIACAQVGASSAMIGDEHRIAARADTLWLDQVRRDLLGRPDVLRHLAFQASDLATRRGDVLVAQGPGGAVTRTTLRRPLQVLLDATAEPTSFDEVAARLTEIGGSPERIVRLLTETIRADIVTSSLSCPITDEDPLGALLQQLWPVREQLMPGTAEIVTALESIHRALGDHRGVTDRTEAAQIRRSTAEAMRGLGSDARVQVSVDTVLDAVVSIPEHVLREARAAADVLVALTRHQAVTPRWATYQSAFWERYGTDCLVPLRDAVDAAAGAGLPPDFPMSLWSEPVTTALPRDRDLARLAWQAAMTGRDEVVLSDAGVDRLRTDTGREDIPVAPHVDVGFRVFADGVSELEQGRFRLAVRPAWAAGVLTGRFASMLAGSGLELTFSRLPTLVEGALPAQLSFAPLFPHAENIARATPRLPLVVSIGEHRASHPDVIGIDDLAVVATGTRLHLASVSRRRVIEPMVLHPLALEKQAPPLARFVAMVGRGFATAWTGFDWGPLAEGMPFLPRVRYRRTVLSPARWTLARTELPAGECGLVWRTGLDDWLRRWRCPRQVELRDVDRVLRLDLDVALHARLLHAHLRRHDTAELTETIAVSDLGWIGHAHEFTAPMLSTGRPLAHPPIAHAPVVTNQMLPIPVGAGQRWVQAKLFTHPADMDHILVRRLPDLLAVLPGHETWFVRYRSLREADHLRLRLAVAPGSTSDVVQAIARWAEALRDDSLISLVEFDGYRPEYGRYGDADALHAAEAVFVADSTAVRHALAELGAQDRHVVCALGMVDIARGLLGDRAGLDALADAPAAGPGVTAVTRETLHRASPTGGTGDDPARAIAGLLDGPAAARRDALAQYRRAVPDTRVPAVLESLLHMHHNRMAGSDRESERVCRHAARQASRSLRAVGVA